MRFVIFMCVIAVYAVRADDVDKLPENELVPSSKLAQLKSRESMDFGGSARGSTFRTFGGFKASFARVEEEALVSEEETKLKNKGASCLTKKSKSWKGYSCSKSRKKYCKHKGRWGKQFRACCTKLCKRKKSTKKIKKNKKSKPHTSSKTFSKDVHYLIYVRAKKNKRRPCKGWSCYMNGWWIKNSSGCVKFGRYMKNRMKKSRYLTQAAKKKWAAAYSRVAKRLAQKGGNPYTWAGMLLCYTKPGKRTQNVPVLWGYEGKVKYAKDKQGHQLFNGAYGYDHLYDKGTFKKTVACARGKKSHSPQVCMQSSACRLQFRPRFVSCSCLCKKKKGCRAIKHLPTKRRALKICKAKRSRKVYAPCGGLIGETKGYKSTSWYNKEWKAGAKYWKTKRGKFFIKKGGLADVLNSQCNFL